MKIRFLRPWRHYKLGQEIEVERGLADMLVKRRRIAELADDLQTLVPAGPGLQQFVSKVVDAMQPQKKVRKGTC